MPARSKKAEAPPDPAALKRETAGRYATGDGRFVVEKGSGGWMLVDAEQTNELGLPLVRGPFGTLDEARASLAAAREGPAPESTLAARLAAGPGVADGARARPTSRRAKRPAGGTRLEGAEPEPESAPPPPVKVREFRARDGDALRALWAGVGFNAVGDDDASLRRFAARNPGLLLVASQGDRIVASALGAWDGRRGWIYHVATASTHRRTGLGTQLVRQVEDRLRELGCPRANVLVRNGNEEGVRFWEGLGYGERRTRQFGRDLEPG